MTGAAQIVEVRELVEDVTIHKRSIVDRSPEALPAIFDDLDQGPLLSVGVPEDWVEDVLNADEGCGIAVIYHRNG